MVGYNTVLDAHAGVKGADGKPVIKHELDLNNDVHYKLQCFQATHGSSMHGINLAHDLIANNKLPLLSKMTNESEKFKPHQMLEAIKRADDRDSLKIIINWD